MITPYYERDGITIYHGDCRDVLPTLERVDHVITDPPYSEVTHEGARTLADLDCRPISFASIKADDAVHLLTMAGSLASRWTIATVDWRHMLALEAVVEPLRFVRFGVWIKPNGAPQFTGDRPATGWEAVAILHRTGGRMRWNCGGHHAVWTENIVQGAEHPTQKPIGLIRQWIADFTDPGDLILDPFGGSGTTARAAKDLGRRCILIEQEEKWCEVAAKRLSQEVMPL